ncbi:MAG: tetratricopeptide repeat protein [Clostridia bacterium]|nr:tetratricopeptide repeat protein [Clostridia bacterium]
MPSWMEEPDHQGMQPVRPVPQQRIAEKVDECMRREDYPGVERVLRYWLAEAEAGHDLRGELMILGEMVGHYRKTGEKENAHACAEKAIALIDALGYQDSLSAATAYVNIATAYHAFGETEEALPLFLRAKAIYENSAAVSPVLLGGLYNNLGLCYAALSRFEEAVGCYDRALQALHTGSDSILEEAIIWMNRACSVEGRDGAERGETAINQCLDHAEACLTSDAAVQDGYYAYVCERCIPTFEYYGCFLVASQLKERVRSIRERS